MDTEIARCEMLLMESGLFVWALQYSPKRQRSSVRVGRRSRAGGKCLYRHLYFFILLSCFETRSSPSWPLFVSSSACGSSQRAPATIDVKAAHEPVHAVAEFCAGAGRFPVASRRHGHDGPKQALKDGAGRAGI